jgi:hypothetical protein
MLCTVCARDMLRRFEIVFKRSLQMRMGGNHLKGLSIL